MEEQNSKLEHQDCTILEHEATIATLKCIVAKQEKGMEALAARLISQDSKIQKVSAQIDMGRPALKVAVNQP